VLLAWLSRLVPKLRFVLIRKLLVANRGEIAVLYLYAEVGSPKFEKAALR
jgi:hypothetical protein